MLDVTIIFIRNGTPNINNIIYNIWMENYVLGKCLAWMTA